MGLRAGRIMGPTFVFGGGGGGGGGGGTGGGGGGGGGGVSRSLPVAAPGSPPNPKLVRDRVEEGSLNPLEGMMGRGLHPSTSQLNLNRV
jgi:hypothetical protein